MIRLYTAATPNGRKVSIALEELGLPYEVVRVAIGASEHPTADFLALTPNHKIPVIDDGGMRIWESGAILLYLAEKHGRLLPEDPKDRIAAIQYAFFQTGGIGPNLGRLAPQLQRPEADRNQEMLSVFLGEVVRLLGVLDRILADDRPFLAGDYSIGDLMHYPWLHPMLSLKAPPLMALPRVVAWLERIAERPAVEKGMAVPE